jgi:hypothetical protein
MAERGRLGIGPCNGDKASGLHLEHGQVVAIVAPDDPCFQDDAFSGLDSNLTGQVAGLGEDEAVTCDDDAQGRVLAVALDADSAFGGGGDNVAEDRQELGVAPGRWAALFAFLLSIGSWRGWYAQQQ